MGTNTSPSVIKLIGYTTKQIDFKINDEFLNNENEKLEIDLDFQIEEKIINNNLELTLTAILFDNYKNENKPFTLKLSILGKFVFEDDVNDDIKKKVTYTNAVAILYPYLRMLISNITCNSGITPIILPVMNISKYLKDKDKLK